MFDIDTLKNTLTDGVENTIVRKTTEYLAKQVKEWVKENPPLEDNGFAHHEIVNDPYPF